MGYIMEKRHMSEAESDVGSFMKFAKTLVEAVREKGMPFSIIYRLATPSGRSLLTKIVDLAYAEWQAEQSGLIELPNGGCDDHQTRSESTFLARVVYVQPRFVELKRRFPAYVTPEYKSIDLDPIECCKAVSKESREVAFEYVHLDRDASTDEVLAEMDRKGLRPALYEELLGFAEKYPDEQRKYPIVALGSEALVHGLRYVACLWNNGDGRHLYLYWIVCAWVDRYRFLAVRK